MTVITTGPVMVRRRRPLTLSTSHTECCNRRLGPDPELSGTTLTTSSIAHASPLHPPRPTILRLAAQNVGAAAANLKIDSRIRDFDRRTAATLTKAKRLAYRYGPVLRPEGPSPSASRAPGGRAACRRISSNCAFAATCCAKSAVWMPWNNPSSQPTS